MKTNYKTTLAILLSGCLLSLGNAAFAGCANYGGYARGNSPVVGGFSGTTYSTYSSVSNEWGSQCSPTGSSVDGATGFWGLACASSTTYASAPSYFWGGCGSTGINIGSCPSNTAKIKVEDYRRADGIVVSGTGYVCVATDTYQ